MLIYLMHRVMRRKYKQFELPEWKFQFFIYLCGLAEHKKIIYST
jgi:hypothetical protein